MQKANGFLFIGDPHIASTAPGRRKDADYPAVVADKLIQAFAIANAENLQPVITGDLFHRERDTESAMLVRLFRALRTSNRIPWCLVGNHDLEETQVTDRVALAAVAETGLLDLIQNGAHATLVECQGILVGLGGTPYGMDIPGQVRGLFQEPPDQVLWVTHTDVRFKQAYPGALEPFEIDGCDLVVNGHMHLEQPSVQAGRTLWVNPGNITRVSVDAIDHKPGVLLWTPLGGLGRRELRFAPVTEVFNLQGRLTLGDTAAAENWKDVGGIAAGTVSRSEFAQMLAESVQLRTGSGQAVLASELVAVAQEEKIPEAALRLLLGLLPEWAETETELDGGSSKAVVENGGPTADT